MSPHRKDSGPRRCTAESRPLPQALDLDGDCRGRRASAAGLFTTNLAQAAPVLVSKQHLMRTGGVARAIVVNSGCANACTGEQGLSDATRMASDVAAALVVRPRSGPGRVNGRDWRQPEDGPCLIRDTGRRRVARARQGKRDGPRDHDHRSVPEGVRRHRSDLAGIIHGRRHSERLGDDSSPTWRRCWAS